MKQRQNTSTSCNPSWLINPHFSFGSIYRGSKQWGKIQTAASNTIYYTRCVVYVHSLKAGIFHKMMEYQQKRHLLEIMLKCHERMQHVIKINETHHPL